jgi:hypothetical protein
LGVATKNLPFESRLKKHFLLFFRTEVIERGHKHVKMQGKWHLLSEKELFPQLIVVVKGEDFMIPE